MNYAERLKSIRMEQELTQTELAKKSNLATSCIAMIEAGKREPSANTLVNLSQALNVSTDYLLCLEDDFGTRTPTPMADSLNDEERKLIQDYRALSPALKEMLQATIKTWSNSTANKHTKKDA